MKLLMGGVDHTTAPVELREKLSFDAEQVKLLDSKIARQEGISGAVLLSTCNRTELYLTGEGVLPHPGRLLCHCAGLEEAPFRSAFVERTGEEAAEHLMEVAAGLQSRIWGEEQILTQVRLAIAHAREAGSADATLNALFQRSLTAGKAVQTSVTFTAIPSSAASQAVELLERYFGTLRGRRAVVIGNGEMGRLSARLLQASGARVTVTLRRYHHRETLVPFGCTAVPYEERLGAIDGADVLFSATTSPHYTYTRAQALTLKHPPAFLMDLAIPRDIEPEAALPGAKLCNVDDFGLSPERTDFAAMERARAIVGGHLAQFRQWQSYRESLGAIDEVKQALSRRLAAMGPMGEQEAAEKAVELLLGGLKGRFDEESLRCCAGKIDAHTRPLRGEREKSFRFPLFTDLGGKRVVVVGGGAVAMRRVGSLLPFGCKVTVIAPALSAGAEGFEWMQRPYQPGDLEGAALAVAATDDREVNRQVGEEARSRAIPVSVADAPEECSFFFPALCEGKEVLAGVCSRGSKHAATARAAAEIRTLFKEKNL